MRAGYPVTIRINWDDYHAKHIGRTDDGRQFFLTTPFVPALKGEAGREFIALYLFDASGTLLEAQIEDLGPRKDLDQATARSRYYGMLAGLGQVEFDGIDIAPFSVNRFGVEFGLIFREPDDEGDTLIAEMQPGNFMAFFAPWDSGDYDT